MGFVEYENKNELKMYGVMDVIIVEQADYSGMLIQPAVPYGIDQVITVNRKNILFDVTPNAILSKIYIERCSESTQILTEQMTKIESQKKIREKQLH